MSITYNYSSSSKNSQIQRKNSESNCKDISGSGVPTTKNNIKDNIKTSYSEFSNMNAYARHKKLCNDYVRYYGKGKSFKEVFERDSSKDKTDLDVVRDEMRFVWDEDDEIDSWEKRLAKKYYDKLFKEYCICDLTLYKQNKIALRWRIETEVLEGKGQFICGSKRCLIRDGLKSWEVNFKYIEKEERKNILVKLRLCPDCSKKLNYFHQKKEIIKQKTVKECKQSFNNDTNKRKSNEMAGQTINEEKKSDAILSCKKKQRIDNDDKKTMSIENQNDNMIVLENGSEIWKTNLENKSNTDETLSREDDIENYLEDLLL